MKKLSLAPALIWIALLLVLCRANVIFAHQPSYIKLSYDSDSKSLRIELHHYVKTPETHHINRIAIFINGEIIDTILPKNRYSEKLVVDYRVKEQLVNNISVRAFCSLHGEIEGELNMAGAFDYITEKYLREPRGEVPQPVSFNGNEPASDLPQDLEPGFGQEETEQDLPQDLEPGFGEEETEQDLPQDLEPGFDGINKQ